MTRWMSRPFTKDTAVGETLKPRNEPVPAIGRGGLGVLFTIGVGLILLGSLVISEAEGGSGDTGYAWFDFRVLGGR